MTKSELNDLNIELRQQFIEGFKKTPIKIIEWYPVRIVEVNGISAIQISYKRQLDNKPEVHVDSYKIFDDDKMHSLTLSYRISEKNLWKENMDKILKSVRITNIK